MRGHPSGRSPQCQCFRLFDCRSPRRFPALVEIDSVGERGGRDCFDLLSESRKLARDILQLGRCRAGAFYAVSVHVLVPCDWTWVLSIFPTSNIKPQRSTRFCLGAQPAIWVGALTHPFEGPLIAHDPYFPGADPFVGTRPTVAEFDPASLIEAWLIEEQSECGPQPWLYG